MNKVTKEEFRLMVEILAATDLVGAYWRGANLSSSEEVSTLENALDSFVYYAWNHDMTNHEDIQRNDPEEDLLSFEQTNRNPLERILRIWVQGYD